MHPLTLAPLVCLTLALLWAWAHAHGKVKLLSARSRMLDLKEERIRELETENVLLRAEKIAAEDKLHLMRTERAQMIETFRLLSKEALESNSLRFLDIAKSTLENVQEKAKGDWEKRQQILVDIVNPVKESLEQLDEGMRKLEKVRHGEQETLKCQMQALTDAEKHLRLETAGLVKALRSPIIRGCWGEMQLRRVVELAGMLRHCDFYEQVHERNDEGSLRPDLLVRLPGGRSVVIDAKVPLEAYLEAVHAQDDHVRAQKLQDHARQLRAHVSLLSKKAYWAKFQPTPEFVVLFLPGESFFSTALEQDPALIEIGVDQGVVIATPTTLIALLRTIAYGWKQESLSRHAQEVSDLGHELYKRLIDFSAHMAKMGRGLTSALDAYNSSVGSFESRVLVTARKFKDLGASSSHHTLESLQTIDRIPKKPTPIGKEDEMVTPSI